MILHDISFSILFNILDRFLGRSFKRIKTNCKLVYETRRARDQEHIVVVKKIKKLHYIVV